MSRTRWWPLGGVVIVAGACTSDDAADDTDAVDTDIAAETDRATDDSDSDSDAPSADDAETDPVDTDPVEGVSPCGAAVATLVVGAGTDAYTPVSEGAELNMVHGPQGGWHFDLSLSLTHTPRFISVEHTLTRVSDSTVISGGPLDGTFRDNKGVVGVAEDDCVAAGSVFGLRSILDTTVLGEEAPWSAVCGQDLRYDVRVLWSWCAAYGETGCDDMRDVVVATDSLTFVGQPDPTDAAPCSAD